MILTEEEVKERVESPMNLLNRLRSITNKHDSQKSQIPSIPPTSDQVIEDLQEKIAYGSIKYKAAGIINRALDELRTRLPEVQKPERLASIAENMSKVINNQADKNKPDPESSPRFIIYSPQIISEQHFEVIRLNE